MNIHHSALFIFVIEFLYVSLVEIIMYSFPP